MRGATAMVRARRAGHFGGQKCAGPPLWCERAARAILEDKNARGHRYGASAPRGPFGPAGTPRLYQERVPAAGGATGRGSLR
jgi:hypothetical protein